MLKYMSGIMEAVTKSTHGYFRSVPVVRGSFPLPAIAVLPREELYLSSLAPSHLALNPPGQWTNHTSANCFGIDDRRETVRQVIARSALEPALGPSCASPTRSSNANSLCRQFRLDSRKSVRPFKGIICDDVSEFESCMPSQAVRSLGAMFRSQKFARHSRELSVRAPLIVPMTFAVWSTLYRIPYGSTPRWRRHWGGSHGSDVSALCRSGRAQGDGCPSRKSYPRVAMMQSGQDWCDHNGPRSLDRSS